MTIKLPLLVATILGSSACAPSPSSDEASATAAVSGGTPITSGYSGKCLDDNADGTGNGNKIQLYACNGTAAQSWTYTNGAFVGPGGKCLDIKADAQSTGTVVELYQCNGTNAQKWTIDGTAIKSTSGYCLDVHDGIDANGTQIQISACNGTEAQVFHFAGSSGTTPPPTSSKTPTLRQKSVEQTNGGSGVWEVSSSKQFSQTTQKGNTIWVAATIPNDGGQANVSVTDTQGNTFESLDFEQDKGKGTQSVWQFYATNIKGDASTPDTITVHWANDNYKGVVIAEIEGVTSASLVGHSGNIQDDDAAKADNSVTSGNIAVSAAQTPALLLALSMDTYGGSSDTGGDGYAGPAYGDGFTDLAYVWNWDPGTTCQGGLACNFATLESKTLTAAGSTAGLFTARAPEGNGNPGEYVTVAAVFH